MRVVIWVLLIVFVLLVIANVYVWDSSNKGSTYSTEIRALYCNYRERERQVMRELTFEMGVNPSDSLQPGDVVVLEGVAVMMPSLGPRSPTVEESMQAIASPARIQPGNTIEIIERVYDDRNQLHYLAVWREESVAGFIAFRNMLWLNQDKERLDAHLRAFEAKVDARMEVVGKAVFAPHGLDPSEVMLKGIEFEFNGKWTPC